MEKIRQFWKSFTRAQLKFLAGLTYFLGIGLAWFFSRSPKLRSQWRPAPELAPTLEQFERQS